MRHALLFDGVHKRFGRRAALDGLDWRVPKGALYGLIGRNGAGKTTALAVAAGLLRPDRGRLNVLGDGPFDASRSGGRLTLLPQDSELPREARPVELLRFYAALQGARPAQARREAEALLEQVHLTDRATSPVRTLSHGMRKRIMIAQCFLGEPELVLLDEPLSGLDPVEAARMRTFLNSRRGRCTIVISSHNLHELERMCDHVGFLDSGKCAQEDVLESITNRSITVTFLLTGREPPLSQLSQNLPRVEFRHEVETGKLVCMYTNIDRDVARINRIVLQCLLDAGCDVLEMHRGERLEDAYLKQFPGSRS